MISFSLLIVRVYNLFQNGSFLLVFEKHINAAGTIIANLPVYSGISSINEVNFVFPACD